MRIHTRTWVALAAGLVAVSGLAGTGRAAAAVGIRPGNLCGLVSGPQLSRILGHGRPHAVAAAASCTWVFPDHVTFQDQYLTPAQGTPVPNTGAKGERVTPEPNFSPGAFVEVQTGATYFAYHRASGGWVELSYRAESSAEMLSVARIVHRHAP